jgi:hypothetical protein
MFQLAYINASWPILALICHQYFAQFMVGDWHPAGPLRRNFRYHPDFPWFGERKPYSRGWKIHPHTPSPNRFTGESTRPTVTGR